MAGFLPCLRHPTHPTSSSTPHLSLTSPYNGPNPLALRSDTRLASQPNSHQPPARQPTDAARREALMAEWRMQNHNSSSQTNLAQFGADERRVQAMMQHDADRWRREKERTEKAKRELAMEQGMRSQGMIDAHKEVMRRMQKRPTT